MSEEAEEKARYTITFVAEGNVDYPKLVTQAVERAVKGLGLEPLIGQTLGQNPEQWSEPLIEVDGELIGISTLVEGWSMYVPTDYLKLTKQISATAAEIELRGDES